MRASPSRHAIGLPARSTCFRVWTRIRTRNHTRKPCRRVRGGECRHETTPCRGGLLRRRDGDLRRHPRRGRSLLAETQAWRSTSDCSDPGQKGLVGNAARAPGRARPSNHRGLNRGPFRLAGFGWDGAGTVTSWEGGHLEEPPGAPCRVRARLSPYHPSDDVELQREYLRVRGDKIFSSGHPSMQLLNPTVRELYISIRRS